MDVRGIGAAGYPAAAFDPKWVRDNAAGGNFAKQVAKAVKNAENRSAAWSFSEKFDWVSGVKNIMQSEYRYGDLKGYMEWRQFLGLLDK